MRKAEVLSAVGAAMAANAIPCFGHMSEKGVTSGITVVEIKKASRYAWQVKEGTHESLRHYQ